MSSLDVGAVSDAREEDIPYDLLDHCSDLIQSVSQEDKFLYVNRAWLDTMGYAAGEISGLKMLDVIHPDWRPHGRDIFQRLISGEEVGLVDLVFVTKDGRDVYLEGQLNCRRAEGRAVATRGIFRDVSERRLAGKSLRERASCAAGHWRQFARRRGLPDDTHGFGRIAL